MIRVTPYRVVRDHSTDTGFFRVSVDYAGGRDRGFGFQLFWRGTVYGLSVISRLKAT
jgi:hypothetical protein